MLEGNILKREWWRRYDKLPEDLPYKIISVDAAFKDAEDNDFVAIQVWGKKDGKFYMIDAMKEHLNFVDTLAAIRLKRELHPDTLFVLIEDKANGSAVINVLSGEMDGVIPVMPEGGKIARVNAISAAIERGDVLLPRYGSFVKEFIDECSAFPNSANDDQVDAMSQALNRMIFVDADVISPSSMKYRQWTRDMFEDYERASESLQKELIELWGYPEEWNE